jgi:hypothetical protein
VTLDQKTKQSERYGFEVDAAALAAQPVRAQVKFEILESADLLAHLEDPPTQKAESGSDLTIEAADPQSSGILQLFSIVRSVGARNDVFRNENVLETV